MKDPLQTIRDMDGALHGAICNDRELAFGPGAISTKYKLLIALALDALEGSVSGVRALATRAIGEGATKEEIAEVLRIAYFIGGVATTYIAAEALKDVFP